MARKPSPWYWPERRGWYTILNGQRHRLLDLPPDAEEPKKRKGKWVVPQEVDTAFHTLFTTPAPCPTPSPSPASLTVAEILDKYLDWCQKHSAPRTYDWYRERIQSFINQKPDAARLPIASLKPFHIIEWTDAHPNWSNAYRRGAIIALQRPFNWAADLGYIEISPIKKIPKPQPQRRDSYVTPEVWEKIKNHYADGDPFRDILEFIWETGCRPQEAKRLELRHLDLAQHRIVIPAEEAKGKKFTRLIWLTPRAEEVLKRHLVCIEGPLFRNEDGQPWTTQAMSCRFGRLKKHLGVKFAPYDLRHGFCQDMLEQGNDAVTVSQLMGHRDGRMVATTYSHMDKAHSHLERVLANRGQGRSR